MISSPTNKRTAKEKKLYIEKVKEVVATEWDENGKIHSWKEQITVKGLVVSLVIGSMYSIQAMKPNLSAGIVPNFNISAAPPAYFFITCWNKVLHKAAFESKPCTSLENTIIETCAGSC